MLPNAVSTTFSTSVISDPNSIADFPNCAKPVTARKPSAVLKRFPRLKDALLSPLEAREIFVNDAAIFFEAVTIPDAVFDKNLPTPPNPFFIAAAIFFIAAVMIPAAVLVTLLSLSKEVLAVPADLSICAPALLN